jgi:hypothetical protein
MSLVSIEVVPNLQQRAGDEVVRVNLLVPATLRKEWKAMALASDKTLTDFIIEAMQHQINRTKPTENATT